MSLEQVVFDEVFNGGKKFSDAWLADSRYLGRFMCTAELRSQNDGLYVPVANLSQESVVDRGLVTSHRDSQKLSDIFLESIAAV
jgi:hypothetical protein